MLRKLIAIFVGFHLTKAESGTKHGQAIRTGLIKESVVHNQIHSVDTNSLKKPVRIASPCFVPHSPVVQWPANTSCFM